jgi:hypothetical protein
VKPILTLNDSKICKKKEIDRFFKFTNFLKNDFYFKNSYTVVKKYGKYGNHIFQQPISINV